MEFLNVRILEVTVNHADLVDQEQVVREGIAVCNSVFGEIFTSTGSLLAINEADTTSERSCIAVSEVSHKKTLGHFCVCNGTREFGFTVSELSSEYPCTCFVGNIAIEYGLVLDTDDTI